MEGVESVRPLGVLLDEHLSWTDHLKYVGKKRLEIYLDKNSLLILYYLYIHKYLNHSNLSKSRVNRANRKKLLFIKQKHEIRIITIRIRLYFHAFNQKFCHQIEESSFNNRCWQKEGGQRWWKF